MLMLASVLSLVFLTPSTHALPVIIRDAPSTPGDNTVAALVESALSQLLASQETSSANFFIPASGMQAISFAGANDTVDDATKNNDIFQLFDVVAPDSNHFSDSYKSFIEDVAKTLSIDPNAGYSNPALKSASDAQAQACGDALDKATTSALKAYQHSPFSPGTPPKNISDPAFLSWAEDHYTPYTEAETNCQAADNNYLALYAQIHGDDFAVFSQALTDMHPLILPDSAPHPGILMEITTGTGAGVYVPAYSIPPLESTLEAWQAGTGLAPSSYASETEGGSDKSTSSSGGASFSFVWESAEGSAGGAGSTTTNATSFSAQSMTGGFGSAALIGIELGVWFDGFRAADALKNVSALSDNVTAAAKPAFEQHFGSASEPGAAAVYNSKALAAYQPKVDITFSSSDSYEKFQTISAAGRVCIVFFCFGGHGASSSDTTTWNDTAYTLSYEDQTDNGYILGYVQTSFWDGQATDQ